MLFPLKLMKPRLQPKVSVCVFNSLVTKNAGGNEKKEAKLEWGEESRVVRYINKPRENMLHSQCDPNTSSSVKQHIWKE